MDFPTPPPPPLVPPAPQDHQPAPYVRPSADPTEAPVWRFADILLIAGFAIASQVILLFFAIGAVHSMKRFHGVSVSELGTSAVVLIPAEFLGYLLLVAFMAQVVRGKYGEKFFKAIRWNMPALPAVFIALGGGAAFAFLVQILGALLSRWIPKSLPVDEMFRDARSAWLVAAFGILVAPFVEELFFRGFLYPSLARNIGQKAAIVLTALPFALIHSPQLAHAWVPLLLLLLFSLVLTTVRARTKSVATTVLMHMGYNLTLFVLLFIATQGFRHMERIAQ